MEIDYASLGYGTPTSINVSEYYKGGSDPAKTHKYFIGDRTVSGSTVTNTGGSIKFGNNSSYSAGDSIYLTVEMNFPNNKMVIGTSPDIVLAP